MDATNDYQPDALLDLPGLPPGLPARPIPTREAWWQDRIQTVSRALRRGLGSPEERAEWRQEVEDFLSARLPAAEWAALRALVFTVAGVGNPPEPAAPSAAPSAAPPAAPSADPDLTTEAVMILTAATEPVVMPTVEEPRLAVVDPEDAAGGVTGSTTGGTTEYLTVDQFRSLPERIERLVATLDRMPSKGVPVPCKVLEPRLVANTLRSAAANFMTADERVRRAYGDGVRAGRAQVAQEDGAAWSELASLLRVYDSALAVRDRDHALANVHLALRRAIAARESDSRCAPF